jgi:predicted helicase
MGIEIYKTGFGIDELFKINVTGIVTARDSLVINDNKSALLKKIEHFVNQNYSDDEIRKYFFGNKKEGKYLAGDSRGWALATARKSIKDNNHVSMIKKIEYRPFDTKFIYYSTNMVDWGREKFMNNFLIDENVGLVVARQTTDDYWSNIQVSKNMIDNRYHFSYKGIPSQFPLYLYPEKSLQQTININYERTPNLNKEIINQIAEKIQLTYTKEKETTKDTFAPIDLLDYIYAVLHSPTYREKYKEFLKIDFPRVPYPKNTETFWQLVKLGGQIREIHLLESPIVEKYITQYPIDGDNVVVKPRFDSAQRSDGKGKVYINDTQYFDNVPEIAWNFYIGGYQPAQKWLKDRKERKLEFDDILHYQKIVVALSETDRLMKEIDKIEIE